MSIERKPKKGKDKKEKKRGGGWWKRNTPCQMSELYVMESQIGQGKFPVASNGPDTTTISSAILFYCFVIG